MAKKDSEDEDDRTIDTGPSMMESPSESHQSRRPSYLRQSKISDLFFRQLKGINVGCAIFFLTVVVGGIIALVNWILF